MPVTRFLTLFVICGAFFCLAVAGADKKPDGSAGPRPAAAAVKADPKVFAGKKAEQDAETALRESASRFAGAYNRHDAKAAAAGFAPNGEFVTEEGAAIRGREAIAKHFAAVFTGFPKVQLAIHVEAIRLITANVAIEEGTVTLTPAPGVSSETSRYSAVHVNQGGGWLLARARDFSSSAAPVSNHERLQELEWLIGEWLEEDEGMLVATSCKWGENRNYLLQDFTIRIGGQPPITGATRIGWDPLTQQTKSWTFDSDGGYSEALWTRASDRWVLKARGVTHLGHSFSRTSILRQIDASTLSWESRDRVEAGALVPDRPPLIVKRRPPPAGD